jgi:hypothetical protein
LKKTFVNNLNAKNIYLKKTSYHAVNTALALKKNEGKILRFFSKIMQSLTD